ncbi:hypothetical protein HDU98_009980 [Podochytrium sp. JEL0797]|nr:hypothetical protein HDU98_009980 [Podochytrium sp. JEL0797]
MDVDDEAAADDRDHDQGFGCCKEELFKNHHFFGTVGLDKEDWLESDAKEVRALNAYATATRKMNNSLRDAVSAIEHINWIPGVIKNSPRRILLAEYLIA